MQFSVKVEYVISWLLYSVCLLAVGCFDQKACKDCGQGWCCLPYVPVALQGKLFYPSLQQFCCGEGIFHLNHVTCNSSWFGIYNLLCVRESRKKPCYSCILLPTNGFRTYLLWMGNTGDRYGAKVIASLWSLPSMPEIPWLSAKCLDASIWIIRISFQLNCDVLVVIHRVNNCILLILLCTVMFSFEEESDWSSGLKLSMEGTFSNYSLEICFATLQRKSLPEFWRDRPFVSALTFSLFLFFFTIVTPLLFWNALTYLVFARSLDIWIKWKEIRYWMVICGFYSLGIILRSTTVYLMNIMFKLYSR